MANFKQNTYQQGIFLPIYLCKQIQKGTFEYTLSKLIDEVLDLSSFESRYNNDETGASAYDPRTLLKVIFLAYSRGVTSSRRISEYCRDNILFRAMSANTTPHYTTIANFVSTMHGEIKDLFLQVLFACESNGLIGKEMFAIDGCKLPSNASKEWSGTIEGFKKKKVKLETAIENILEKHEQEDLTQFEPETYDYDEKYIESLRKDINKISEFLNSNQDRIGLSGKPVQSNITDNESAKMHTSKGVIQGYVGVAAVDQKHQVIVNAEAFGQGYEQNLLKPTIEATRANFFDIGHHEDIFKNVKLTADNGYHSEENVAYIFSENIDGYIPDKDFRKRDPRFAESDRYNEMKESNKKPKTGNKFVPADFTFAEDLSYCICPAGQRLYRSGKNVKINNKRAYKFKGPKSSCVPCTMRKQCLRKPDKTEIRQVAYFSDRIKNIEKKYTEQMKGKIDSDLGRVTYAQRLGIAEPPFANIRFNLGLDRFSLRGQLKVNTQWNLFCILHNIIKLHNFGGCFA